MHSFLKINLIELDNFNHLLKSNLNKKYNPVTAITMFIFPEIFSVSWHLWVWILEELWPKHKLASSSNINRYNLSI